MKPQNFFILPTEQQVTIILIYTFTYFRTAGYFYCFIVSIVVHMYSSLVTVRLWSSKGNSFWDLVLINKRRLFWWVWNDSSGIWGPGNIRGIALFSILSFCTVLEIWGRNNDSVVLVIFVKANIFRSNIWAIMTFGLSQKFKEMMQ